MTTEHDWGLIQVGARRFREVGETYGKDAELALATEIGHAFHPPESPLRTPDGTIK